MIQIFHIFWNDNMTWFFLFQIFLGGGAIEMNLSKYLRDYSRNIAGKEQSIIGALAGALEIIPRQLCDNAGFDATTVLNKLRQKHAQGKYTQYWIIKILYVWIED